METDSAKKWLFESVASRFATALNGGEARWEAMESAPETYAFGWRQDFEGLAGSLWIVASGAIGPNVLACAFDGVAQDLSARLGREVICSRSEESVQPAAGCVWARISSAGEIFAAASQELLDAIDVSGESRPASQTFDLLLDVELPVSVSFGRAQIPLKDVLKLTTGAIVELNRSIAEPVEVIVNNCVIARGEVVVVDGNFGVRIQQVISRQERLRTLQ
ncbi:MAG TPA: flagellar motor switch protein FliN [Bryobacteraceae bacterium]|nr:flagellar motor switch protein FliN [Bryobacteraceae bacterium]